MSRKLGTANIRCGDLVTCVAVGKPLRIVFVFGISTMRAKNHLKTKQWEPKIAVGTKHFETT